MDTSCLRPTDRGLACDDGGFFIDPRQPVERAVITHAHGDHAVRGCGRYLTTKEGAGVLRLRMGTEATIDAVEYGEPVSIGGVRVSLHPAGHILGSAQVRVEQSGRVCVAAGDYKDVADPTCRPFEPVRCHTFITESTFGLPIYRWPAPAAVFDAINAWWRANREAGRASLLYGYSLGKAQRLLAGVDLSIGPIYTHGAVEALNRAYRDEGVALPKTTYAGEAEKGIDGSGALVVAPPSAHGSAWARRFGPASSAFASGWMRIRGTRRRKSVDRGFVLSDHADWPGLLGVIEATGAETVWVTHGYTGALTRYLTERGIDAVAIALKYGEASEEKRTSPEAAEDNEIE